MELVVSIEITMDLSRIVSNILWSRSYGLRVPGKVRTTTRNGNQQHDQRNTRCYYSPVIALLQIALDVILRHSPW